MIKKLLSILILILWLLGSGNLFAQDNPDSIRVSGSSVFVEFGGNAPFISLNYEYLAQTRNEKVKCAAVIGFTHHFNDPFDFLIAPQYNVLIGRDLMAEIGAGVTIPISYIDDWIVVMRLGGRYQKTGGRMFYKLAFTPILSPNNDVLFLPMLGISVGYRFKCKGKK